MRKVLLYLIIFVLICFFLPVIFTPRSEKVSKAIENKENVNEENQITESTYDYKNYKEITLYHTETKNTEKIPLDEYLYGVVSAEMPASFEEEALKAQAIVARTYTLYKIQNSGGKHKENNADICDSASCCQAWITKEDRLSKWNEEERESNWNKIVNAVNNTQGKIITYDGKVINAFFHSNSGGKTESPINVWGGSNYPYLQAVQTDGEDAYSQYKSEVTLSKDDFVEKIKEEHKDFEIDFAKEDCIKIKEYTEGDRVKTIQIGNLELTGVEVRNIFSLRSANFKFYIDGDNIKFEVIGYGHGVGMSQTGADSLAKQGKNCEEIIKHYYTGVEIIDM